MFLRDKKAEMSSKMIISLILLLSGFAILLSVFFSFGDAFDTDREVCHQSVLLRATTQIDSLGLDLTSLNCKTQKKCITSKGVFSRAGSDSCGGVFKGSKDVEYIKVDSKEDIEKFLANEVIDCWTMMGEGRLSLFSKFLSGAGLRKIYSSCVLCSRIAFDKDLDISEKELMNLDVYNYMLENNIPGKQITYAEYFSDSPTKPVFSGESFRVPVVSDEEINYEDKNLDEDFDTENPSKPNELGVVFMQISTPEQFGSLFDLAKVGAYASATTFFSPAGGIISKTVSSACAGAGPICAAIGIIAFVGGIGVQQANVYNSRTMAAGLCTDSLQGQGDGRSGCSVVRVVDYDPNGLGEFCSVIESY